MIQVMKRFSTDSSAGGASFGPKAREFAGIKRIDFGDAIYLGAGNSTQTQHSITFSCSYKAKIDLDGAYMTIAGINRYQAAVFVYEFT